MFKIPEKIYRGSETIWKVGAGSGSEKNHSRSTTLNATGTDLSPSYVLSLLKSTFWSGSRHRPVLSERFDGSDLSFWIDNSEVNTIILGSVGIQASRLSTSLHQTGPLGRLPAGPPTCGLFRPLETFLPAPGHHETLVQANNRTAAKVLLLLVIPGKSGFLFSLQRWSARRISINKLKKVVIVKLFLQETVGTVETRF